MLVDIFPLRVKLSAFCKVLCPEVIRIGRRKIQSR